MSTTRQIVSRFETKAVDNEARTFEGYASTWDLDLGGDVIRPGAFKRTLDHWQGSGRAIPLLDSHRAFDSITSALGKLEEAKETERGLWTKFSVIDDDDGAKALKRIEAGVVGAMSIGYNAVKTSDPTAEEKEDGIHRYLDEVKLREVSLVLFPMNEEARIDLTSVKSMLLTADNLTDADLAELEHIRDRIDRVLADSAPKFDATDLATRLHNLKAAQLATRIRNLKASA